eukprot:464246-Pleurochrysis_carterae.AAC.1
MRVKMFLEENEIQRELHADLIRMASFCFKNNSTGWQLAVLASAASMDLRNESHRTFVSMRSSTSTKAE